MPRDRKVTLPNGKTFVVPDVPDGASDAEVWARAQALYGDKLNPAASDGRSATRRFVSGVGEGLGGDAAGAAQTGEAVADWVVPGASQAIKGTFPGATAMLREWKMNALAPTQGAEWWGRQAGAAAPFIAASFLPGIGEMSPLARIAAQAGIGGLAGASQPTREGGVHPDAIAAGAALGGAGGAVGEALGAAGARGAAAARRSRLASEAADLVRGSRPFEEAIKAGATIEQADAYAAEAAKAARERRAPDPHILANIFGPEFAGRFLHMPFLGHAGAIAGSLPALARGAHWAGTRYGAPLSKAARAAGQGAATEGGEMADDPRMGYSVTPAGSW